MTGKQGGHERETWFAAEAARAAARDPDARACRGREDSLREGARFLSVGNLASFYVRGHAFATPSMDPLCGIDGSRPSPPRSRKMARRDSSISLEEGPVPVERHSPQTHHSKDKGVFDSAKSPLPLLRPHELQTPTTIREASPEDGCPLLPSEPSIPSSPTVTAPMDVFLVYEDDHEKMRAGGVAPAKAAQVKQLRSEPAASSLGTSSWQHPSDDDVDPSLSDEAQLSDHDKMPRTPVLQPIAGRAMTESSSYVMVGMIPSEPIEAEDDPSEMPDPSIQTTSTSEALGTSNGIDGGIRRYDDSLLTHDDNTQTDSHAGVAGDMIQRRESGEQPELESQRKI
ncbi:uncharacterized protein NECHADRAFT_75625 [Fusarium vanettenii 77-13-4]|uniref:Uncharacterized protein n=1 Tax=Fusarium vanettenii (strain ATCC MYA-4622 / CBS 123669 / FGSC 9596 / NRRL 45880 / 77-13-4) TaxID=660122 RepID=C7YJB9_FUSV7|nr:uncharacterized protein NECHADRAFT_75625 [Fusarium vanettenii 77-13-4]EEU48245.1 predicted protein [Fusarium vanettenii 77-13-4]